jgi:peptide/nickel transport system substrate-binding protein
MFPDEFPWKAASEPIPYDPQKAKELLDEAQLPVNPSTGNRFTLNLKVTTSKSRIAVAKAIAAQLQDIGIAVQVESLEFGVFMDRLREGAISSWLASWTGFKDPDHLHFCFHSSMAPPEGGNRGNYSNPELDELVAKGKIESDPEARRGYYLRAQEIVNQDQPYTFLWHPRNVAVVKKNLKGFRLYSDGRYLALPEVFREP